MLNGANCSHEACLSERDSLWGSCALSLQAFDQLLLLKRGGQTIYCGPLGKHSSTLVAYFEVQPQQMPMPQMHSAYRSLRFL